MPKMAPPSGAAVIAAEWTLTSIALAAIVARLYLRLRINRQRLLISDYFMILALCSSVATSSFDIAFLRLGVLKPEVQTNLAGITDVNVIQTALKYFWVSNFPFFTTFYLCKASILAVYLQIFPPQMKTYRKVLYFIIAYSVMGYIISVCLSLFLCFPVQRQWDISIEMCSDSSITNVFVVAWAFNFSSDILILLAPFMILPTLNMRRPMKIGLYFVFGLGIINIAFSLTRFLTIQLSLKGTAPLTTVDLWSGLDSNIGLIIACLPSLRPYVRLISKDSLSSSDRYHTHSEQQHFHSRTLGTSKVATGRFSRISSSKDRNIHVRMTVEQHDVEKPDDENKSRDDILFETQKDSTAIKSDETSSDIELIPWSETEPEKKWDMINGRV